MRLRSDLRNYQRAGVKFIKDKKKCALFVDMGLGKTAISLTAIADLAADLEIGKVLVVAPKRVARKVWTDEAAEWTHTRGLLFSRVLGTPAQRVKALNTPADVYLITTDLVKWLYEHYEGLDFPFDAIFIDESSKYKHRSSNRTKAMTVLCRAVNYVVLLTGTPSANGLHDLWAQIYLIDRGARLGHTLKAFRERYFHPNFDGNGYRPMKHAENAIQRRLADICFTLRSEDYLELPERVDNMVYVDLSTSEMDKYREFERKFILQVSEETEIHALSASALYQKLLQLANGVIYDSDRNEHPFHTEKLDALEEIIDEANGEPVFVAYNFKSDIKAIRSRFPDAVVLGNDMETIDRWNRGEIQLMLAHPQSAGHGLNLQFGGGIIVWYGLTWNLENYLQFNKRVHRHGQTRKSVFVHHILSRGTIDEKVMRALQQKDRDQNSLLDALKEHVKGLLLTA